MVVAWKLTGGGGGLAAKANSSSGTKARWASGRISDRQLELGVKFRFSDLAVEGGLKPSWGIEVGG